jgi:hypothetical protein
MAMCIVDRLACLVVGRLAGLLPGGRAGLIHGQQIVFGAGLTAGLAICRHTGQAHLLTGRKV